MSVRRWLVAGLFLISSVPSLALAQATFVSDTVTYEKAQVMRIASSSDSVIPGTDTSAPKQTITVNILQGTNAGHSVTFDNDYIQLAAGDVFYLRHTSNALDGTDYYSVADPYRLPVLGALVLVFLILLFYFGGMQGVRGTLSLIGSIILIFYVLTPGILHGNNPIAVALGVSSLIVILGSYITHGFNRTTTSAVCGMIATVIITGIGAYIAVHAAHLTGYNSETNVYLNFDTRGTLDMAGILFAGILIGLLGVLYDIAIGQAVAVDELYGASNDLSRSEVYRRASRIGREHIGALVNTLAIAYVGASLPLLLLLVNSSTTGILFTLNNELFATEIVRILIGSIGLVLAVPITTSIASYMLQGGKHSRISHGHRH
jgi:uncharacterized membrane protein